MWVLGKELFQDSLARNTEEGRPRLGIGNYTRIHHAIINKNVRIGDPCVITPDGKPDMVDHTLYYIRDGVVIIPKHMVIPHRTVI